MTNKDATGTINTKNTFIIVKGRVGVIQHAR